MELAVLRGAESKLRLAAEKVATMSGKLDDLTFRAQRIASSMRGGTGARDGAFLHDMQVFRREVRAFGQEVEQLPDALSRLHPEGAVNADAEAVARSIQQWAERLPKVLEAFWEKTRLAHSHMREADAKIEAWYLVSDCEQLAEKAKAVAVCGKNVLVKFSARAV